MKRIGYAKMGRSIDFSSDKWGFQGDAEAPNLLYRLAERNPDVTWVVVGRNSKQKDFPFPNIENPWASRPTGSAPGFADKLGIVMGTLDGIVMHVGQHGTSHSSIPFSKSTWAQYFEDPETHATTPQDWATAYAGFLIKGINTLCDRTNGQASIVYLIPDPRNFINARDIKWPTGLDDILAQYQYKREQRHERFRDPRTPDELGFGDQAKLDREGEVWVARHTYRYADLELMILPNDWDTWGATPFKWREPIGVATTSFEASTSSGPRTGPYDTVRRSELVRDFILANYPDAQVYGKWDKVSLQDVPQGTVELNKPHEFAALLGGWRTTVVLPALNTSWTVSKFWQASAARTAAFMVANVDDQGWLLPSRRRVPGTHEVADGLYSVRNDWTSDELVLATWLRVELPDELNSRVKSVANDEGAWSWIVNTQRNLLQRRWDAHYLENEIERRLGIHE